MLGIDDPRRRMVGAISEWEYVTTPSPAYAPLAGSPAAATSWLYSPNEISQVSNFYHNQVLAPTLNQQVLVQNDTGCCCRSRSWALGNHERKKSKEMNNLGSSLSGYSMGECSSRLRLEFLQAENRLQHREEAVRAAGDSMANKHCSEVFSQMRREATDVSIKLHQAETTVNEVVHHAERELAAKAQARSAADSMSGQLNQLRSCRAEKSPGGSYGSRRNFLCASQCLTIHGACDSSVPWNCYAPRNGWHQ